MHSITLLSGRQLKVPVIAPEISKLLEIISDDQIPFEQLSAALEHFPTISARLIWLANSAWVGAANPVTSLDEACTRLGFNIVKSTSIALAISSPFNMNKCPAFDAKLYWLNALMVAESAFSLTRLLEKQGLEAELDAQSLRTIGLLHNIGLVWLADAQPRETATAITEAHDDEQLTVNQALKQRFGINYPNASGLLAEALGLPEPFQILLREQNTSTYHGPLQTPLRTLGAAKELVRAIRQNDPHFNGPNPFLSSFTLERSEWRKLYCHLEERRDLLSEMAALMLQR